MPKSWLGRQAPLPSTPPPPHVEKKKENLHCKSLNGNEGGGGDEEHC